MGGMIAACPRAATPLEWRLAMTALSKSKGGCGESRLDVAASRRFAFSRGDVPRETPSYLTSTAGLQRGVCGPTGGQQGVRGCGRTNGATVRRGSGARPRGQAGWPIVAAGDFQMPAVFATENSPPRGARLAAPPADGAEQFALGGDLPLRRQVFERSVLGPRPAPAIHRLPRGLPFSRTRPSNIFCSFIVLAPRCVVPAADHPHAGVTLSQRFGTIARRWG